MYIKSVLCYLIFVGSINIIMGNGVRRMRKILIVVDMQKDFIDGSLGTKEAQKIVPAVVKKIQSYPVSDIYVTKDTHGENYLETSEGKHLPVVHCIKGTEMGTGWES